MYQQQQEQQQEQVQQDAENPFLDPPFSRIKIGCCSVTGDSNMHNRSGPSVTQASSWSKTGF
jgi:hypothetical protein